MTRTSRAQSAGRDSCEPALRNARHARRNFRRPSRQRVALRRRRRSTERVIASRTRARLQARRTRTRDKAQPPRSSRVVLRTRSKIRLAPVPAFGRRFPRLGREFTTGGGIHSSRSGRGVRRQRLGGLGGALADSAASSVPSTISTPSRGVRADSRYTCHLRPVIRISWARP